MVGTLLHLLKPRLPRHALTQAASPSRNKIKDVFENASLWVFPFEKPGASRVDFPHKLNAPIWLDAAYHFQSGFKIRSRHFCSTNSRTMRADRVARSQKGPRPGPEKTDRREGAQRCVVKTNTWTSLRFGNVKGTNQLLALRNAFVSQARSEIDSYTRL